MCSLFRNKYRIEPCRLKGHDYSKGGSYFVTICTSGKEEWFGDILNHQMILSDPGLIAKKLWQELPEHFSFISLDEFIIMPDHLHGIIIIDPCINVDDDIDIDVETLHATSLPEQQPKTSVVETLHATSLQPPPQQREYPQRNPPQPTPPHAKNEYMSSISPKHGTLATIIRSYKSAVAKNVHLTGSDFSWQSRYYDHLIRSYNELERIRKYIIDNPANWQT